MNVEIRFGKLTLDVSVSELHAWRQLAVAIKNTKISGKDLPGLSPAAIVEFDKILVESNKSVESFMSCNASTDVYMAAGDTQFHVDTLTYNLNM